MRVQAVETAVSEPYGIAGAAVYSRHRGVQSGVLSALLDVCSQTGAGSVLEIGCGTAAHLQAVGEMLSCACWGIDPSPAMLGQHTELEGTLRLCRARAEALPIKAGRFDVAFSVDVVHHLADLDAAYAEMARALRPGGMLLSATDSEATIRARQVLSGYFPDTVPHELARYPAISRLEDMPCAPRAGDR